MRAVLLATVIVLWPCQSAYAQQSAASITAAEALFEQGREAMTAGDLDTACARFRESNRLDPALGTRLNLADCEEKRGKVATAWSLFRGAVAELDPEDDRMPVAQERIEALQARIPKLLLNAAEGSPRDLKAAVAGAEFGIGSFGVPLPMDPGHYDIVVSAEGTAERRYEVILLEGETAELTIAAGESEARPAPAPVEADSDLDRHTWTYVAGGIGIAGIAVGAVTGVMTLQQKGVADDNCRDALKLCNQKGADANDAGRTYGTISTIGFVVGALGLGGATYLMLTAPDEPESAGLRAEVGKESAFLSYEKRF